MSGVLCRSLLPGGDGERLVPRYTLVYYLSIWYRREERQYRISHCSFSAASLVGAIGIILAWVQYSSASIPSDTLAKARVARRGSRTWTNSP